jgi:FdhE protein
LRCILRELEASALPEASHATVARLRDTDDTSLESLAETLLAGDHAGGKAVPVVARSVLADRRVGGCDTALGRAGDNHQLDRAAVPFIGAALQAYWLHLVTTLGADAFGRLEVPHLCPACGSVPIVSVVRSSASDHGLRYLTCSLCNTQWHAVRIKCVFCDTTKGIAYYGIEGGNAAVKAESCETCHGYLKILYMEKGPHMDALADDVASVALDVLMAEAGVSRRGRNFFLF